MTSLAITDDVFWRVVGFGGSGLFAARWALQFLASRRAGGSVVPPSFWFASLGGSMLLLAYFACGPKHDVVGVLGNVFPAFVAANNIRLIVQARKKGQAADCGVQDASLHTVPGVGLPAGHGRR